MLDMYLASISSTSISPEAEMQRILSDKTTYKKLKEDPTNKLKKKQSEWIKKGTRLGILDKKEACYLNTKAPILAVIYQVPKVHKNKNQPPERQVG